MHNTHNTLIILMRIRSRCAGGKRYASRTCAEDRLGVSGVVVFGCNLSRHWRSTGYRAFGHGRHNDEWASMSRLGIFLLVAVRNPSAHRSLIAFAAWSSFAHAVVMSLLGFEITSERVGFLIGSAVLLVIGVTLIVLAPEEQSGQRA